MYRICNVSYMAHTFKTDEFGKTVERIRTDRNLTLRPAARQIGIGHTTLWRIEHGQDATIDAAAKLALWAGLSLDSFVDGKAHQ